MGDEIKELECRVLRWSDSSTAGRTVTLELDPDSDERHPFRDYPSGKANGQRLRILYATIADDESSALPPAATLAPARSLPQNPSARLVTPAEQSLSTAEAIPETSSTLSPGRAGQITDNQLIQGQKLSDARARGKQAYAESDEMKRAVVRSGILCGERRFANWLQERMSLDEDIEDAQDCAAMLRAHLDISSRTVIGTSQDAYERFLALETDYRISQGLQAEPR